MALFEHLENSTSQELASFLEEWTGSEDVFLFERNKAQETPLGACLHLPAGEDAEDKLQVLLDHNAARSIFVRGYLPDSLVCALPTAAQPESTAFYWPEPIEIEDERRDMIDNALADHIQSLLDKKESTNDEGSDSDQSPELELKPQVPLSTFDHYPQVLKVGDVVRRGPHWRSNCSDDIQSGTQHAGVVKSVSGPNSGTYRVNIYWQTDPDPSSTNTAFKSESYDWKTMSSCPLYLIDPANPSARPKNIPKPPRAVPETEHYFKVGNLVRLRRGVHKSSVAGKKKNGEEASATDAKSAAKKQSENCLGDVSDGRVGVIVKICEGTHKDDSGNEKPVYRVMELQSGNFCEYALKDLVFADDSSPEEHAEVEDSLYPTRKISSKFVPSNSISNAPSAAKVDGKFKKGDRVRLKKNASVSSGGSLGSPSDKYVGVVDHYHSSSKDHVNVHPVGGQKSGCASSYYYQLRDLEHVDSEGPGVEALPLIPGDVVQLSADFTENGGDGWCLGKVSDDFKKIRDIKGRVVYASVDNWGPKKGKANKDQRNVVVESLSSPGKYYHFRSSWVKRVDNLGNKKLKVGDRVKLDIGSFSHPSKCLGNTFQGSYGIVASVGTRCGGIHRNVEVVAVTGERKGSVSLYPGYALQRANRADVMTDADAFSLAAIVQDFLANIGMGEIDAALAITEYGHAIWSFLGALPGVLPDALFDVWRAWDSARNLAWPAAAEKSEEVISHLRKRKVCRLTGAWKCTNVKCPFRGGFDRNPVTAETCTVCHREPDLWSCSACSAWNRVMDLNCVVCFTHRSDVDKIEEQKRDRKRKQNAAVASEATAPAVEDDTGDAAGPPSASEEPPINAEFGVYVQNIGFDISGSDLAEFFLGKGLVVGKVELATKVNGESKGMAKVFFSDLNTRAAALKLHGENLLGRKIKLSELRTKPAATAAAGKDGATSKKDQKNVGNKGKHGNKSGAEMASSESAAAPLVSVDEFEAFVTERLQCIATAFVEDVELARAAAEAAAAAAKMESARRSSKGRAKISKEGEDDEDEEEVFVSEEEDGSDNEGEKEEKTENTTDTNAADTSTAGSSAAAAPIDECITNTARREFYYYARTAPKPPHKVFDGLPPVVVGDDIMGDDDIAASLAVIEVGEDEELPGPVPMHRQTSQGFFELAKYEPIDSIHELVTAKDKHGNTIAHYLAYLGLSKSLKMILLLKDSQEKSESPLFNPISPWEPNLFFNTPRSLAHKSLMPLKSGEVRNKVFKHLQLRGLCPVPPVMDSRFSAVKAALDTPLDYEPSDELAPLIAAIRGDERNEDNAAYEADQAVSNKVPHAKLYRALYRLDFNFSTHLAKKDIKEYLVELQESLIEGERVVLDPLYYFVQFLLWKKELKGGKPSYALYDRLRAYDALKLLRLYPFVCKLWLSPKEDHDEVIEMDPSIDLLTEVSALEDDDYSDLIPPPGPEDPETIWERAKTDFELVSPAMDQLMALIGLKEVKQKAIDVALSVLLDPPKYLNTKTSMNFLFVGNPGTGKTTCANLLAKALVDLKYRKNPNPVFTSADTLLASQDPVALFDQLVKSADGGTMFIDEAYLFNPAPKGSTANDSNKVLNALMNVATQNYTTTFILAGYREELEATLTYNPGFASRFPKRFTFDFVDYTEAQLTKILVGMCHERKLRFASAKECGVPLARVLARRLPRTAKGFDNARACEKLLEACIQNRDGRLVRMKCNKIPIREYDYITLTREDTVGDRPKLEDSPYMQQLESMVGLAAVKKKMRNMMELQLQNYDSEMRGEPRQLISLHRLFLGRAGTGKTTVATLYGLLLKEFGFLSDGGMILKTPSDLKGAAAGEGAQLTRQVLELAKGKVLFIDEAYNLDPKRHIGSYGAEVIDTILEKISATEGSDMALVMAGYTPQMTEFIENANNEGLKRRLNLSEAFYFEDFSDEDIKKVLKQKIVQAGLDCESSTLDFAVELISMKRMDSGFGNAGEAEQILTHAKQRQAARLTASAGEAVSNPDTPPIDFKLLVRDDFAGEERSVEKARAAFADLVHTDHIEKALLRFEALVNTAKEEGKKPYTAVPHMHMLFLGQAGTGKTTTAKRFATMFKHLEILGSDRFTYTTAGNLIDRFVGGTTNNTRDIMRKALGGVLMIDEAYAMLPTPENPGSYFGMEILQTLLENITTEEFYGRLIVILGGYKDDIERLFKANQGFQSRFDKIRVTFPSWTAEQAAEALIQAIKKDDKEVSEEAAAALPDYFRRLIALPNWASARDVFENIKPPLEIERALRSSKLAKERRLLEEAREGTESGTKAAVGLSGRHSAAAKKVKQQANPPIPYELSDFAKVFEAAIAARSSSANVPALPAPRQSDAPPAFRHRDQNAEAPPPPKIIQNNIVRTLESGGGGGSGGGMDEDAIWAALEDALGQMGYEPEQIHEMLEDADSFPPPELVDIVMGITGTSDEGQVKAVLAKQRVQVLQNVKKSISEASKPKTAEEEKIQEALSVIGKCPMGFAWLKDSSGLGYRCAGGSHYCSNEAIKAYMIKCEMKAASK